MKSLRLIEDRLEYTLRIGAFEGTDEEFYVATSQVGEAVKELRRLRDLCDVLVEKVKKLEGEKEELLKQIENVEWELNYEKNRKEEK